MEIVDRSLILRRMVERNKDLRGDNDGGREEGIRSTEVK
jgi:hypothetical protein